MPKKKTLWKRETPCMVCEKTMINYQYITKSQTIYYDDWLIVHYQPVSNYDDFPESMRTTICPSCLTASNEFSFGVDDYKYFARAVSRHEQIKEYYKNCTEDRFKLLAETYGLFEEDSAVLDAKSGRPANTRTRATMAKIWQNKEKYAIPFFTMMFQEPRDFVTTLVTFAMDRYCQLVRISFDNNVDPPTWDHPTLKSTIEDHFKENKLDMKSPVPRFYYIGSNYLQCCHYLENLIAVVGEAAKERHGDLLDDYWREAYQYMRFSFDNDDLNAIPCELGEGGMNLLMARLHLKFGDGEAGKKCLRFAKNYADNKLKRISNKNQQKFVNDTEDLFKEMFANDGEEGEG